MADVRFMVKYPEGRLACKFCWRIERGRQVTVFLLPIRLRKRGWKDKAED